MASGGYIRIDSQNGSSCRLRSDQYFGIRWRRQILQQSYTFKYHSTCLHPYIYNGNIFPSLNPAKIFQFISRWTESTKSSAVGPNHRAVINTSNEVKSPLLWEFWIHNFSLRILERVLRWKHCKYKEWVSFFLGSWGMNRSAEQTNRPRTASRFTRFVCPVLRFIPHEPRKKDTHSLNTLIIIWNTSRKCNMLSGHL